MRNQENEKKNGVKLKKNARAITKKKIKNLWVKMAKIDKNVKAENQEKRDIKKNCIKSRKTEAKISRKKGKPKIAKKLLKIEKNE